MEIKDIRDEVIVEVGGDVSDSALQSKIFQFIKTALRRFPRHTKTRLLIDTYYATLESGEYYLTTPPYFIQERVVYYIDNGKRKEISKLPFDDFNEQFDSTSTSEPNGYRIIGNVIEFLHPADKDYVIYVEFFKEIDDVNLTNKFFGDTSMIEILKDGVKYYYFQYTEDDARANAQLTLFKIGLDVLENSYIVEELPDYIQEN